MLEKQKIGKFGENLADDYLKDNGYKIIDKNFRFKWGDEIDIIAKSSKGILTFVEVKTIRKYSNNSEINPEDNLTIAKLKKLQRGGNFYANMHPELTKKGWQIDLVAIEIIENDLTSKSNSYEIKHYENI